MKYVVGSEPIRRDCLQLTISMVKLSVDDAYNYTSVVCLYCMAVLDSTSGSLLQEGGVSITVRVTLLLTHCTSHHLWERITSVSLGMCTLVSIITTING